MLPIPITTALLALAWPQESDPGPAGRQLSAQAVREDLDILREAIEVIHPGLGRYVPADDFERGWETLVDAVTDRTTDLELYRDISLLIAGLRCGHSRVEAPEWLDTYREKHPTHLPFHFRLLEGRMFVEVASDDAGLPRGTEVLSIDGNPLGELVQTIAATVPVDGWTDSIRPSRLQTAYEFQDSGFDHYLPLFAGFRARFELEIRKPDAEASEAATVPAVTSGEWKALEPSVGWSDFVDAVSWRYMDQGAAILEVGTFVNYRRSVDPEAKFSRIFRELREAGVEHLVLDLRECGGGSADVCWTLARFLIDQPVSVGGPRRLKNIRFGRLVPHLSTWTENAFEQPEGNFRRLDDGWYELREEGRATLEPHQDRFRGRITILVGPYNASGTTMLLAKLREARGIRLVGESTGGSAEGPTAGVLFFLTLPNSGVRVNVPVIRETTGLRSFRPGYGVEPDVLVRPTTADFMAGRDAVLEAALALDADEPPWQAREIPGFDHLGQNEQGYQEYAFEQDPTLLFVLVPGGTFRIGSDDGDFDERPRTLVTLSPYLIAKHELTNAQFARFCHDTGNPTPPAPSFDQGYLDSRPEHPVLNLTWEDARDYCDWAGLDLPTEAQWEYAAIGGDGRRFPWGNASPAGLDIPFDQAEDRGPQAVGDAPNDASPFGIFDMGGNVSEWCFDAYDHYSEEPAEDPTGADPTTATHHVFRGGAWISGARYVRSAYRSAGGLGYRDRYLGFRLSRGPEGGALPGR